MSMMQAGRAYKPEIQELGEKMKRAERRLYESAMSRDEKKHKELDRLMGEYTRLHNEYDRARLAAIKELLESAGLYDRLLIMRLAHAAEYELYLESREYQ